MLFTYNVYLIVVFLCVLGLGLQEAYERMLFRDALKNAAYDLGSARDLYRCVGGR